METPNRYTLLLVIALCILDCLTTAVGYLLGATEFNPMMALLLNVSIFAFVSVKLGVMGTIYVCMSFMEKAVVEMKQTEPHHLQTKLAKYLWTGILYGLAVLMVFVSVNNVMWLTVLI